MTRCNSKLSPMRTITLLLVFGLSIFTAQSQICKPELTVFFDSDKHELILSEEKKLDRLLSSLESDGNYAMEIYAHTDSDASNDYNMDLSTRRGEQVSKYLQDNFTGDFSEISIHSKGEDNPKYDNSVDNTKKLNRRVEIILFPIRDGKLVLTGENGSEVAVNREFFGNCNICGSEPKMEEISNNDQALQMGLNMGTEEGGSLETGGMIMLTSECGETLPCVDATIRIPAEDINPYMQIWEANDTVNNGDWTRGTREMIFEDGYYVLNVVCFSQNYRVNADIYIEGGEYGNRELATPFPTHNLKVLDSTSNVVQLYDHPQDTMVWLEYAYYLPPERLRHEAVEEGIRYRFRGPIQDRHIKKAGSLIEIPRADYSLELLLSDTVSLVKLPGNAKELSVHITKIDSLYDRVGSTTEAQRKFEFRQPIAAHDIVVCRKSTEKYGRIPEDGMKVKYIKRKKRLKIRIKRSAVKKI